jgi:hypothetical protein
MMSQRLLERLRLVLGRLLVVGRLVGRLTLRCLVLGRLLLADKEVTSKEEIFSLSTYYK